MSAKPLDFLERPPMIEEQPLMAVIWAFLAVATFFTAFRFYIRFKFFHRLYLDDALVFTALFFLATSAVLYRFTVPLMYTVSRVRSGLQVPPPNIIAIASTYMKLQFAITTLFWTCLWTVKFSFLAFFHKLGQGLRGQRIRWTIVLVITTIAYIGCVISYPISCPSFEADHCNTQRHIQRSLISLRYSTAVDVLTDAMIILLPINLLWKVKMNVREKIALGTIFSLGGIIIIFAIIRVCVLNQSRQHPELTWLALWSAIESSVAVIVSCLASFKTLFARSGQSEYMYGSGRNSGRRKKGLQLGEQGHHLVTVRGGPIRRHDSLVDQLSLEDDDVQKKHEVRVQTDVEVSHAIE